MSSVMQAKPFGAGKSSRKSAIHLVQSSQFAQRVARFVVIGLVLSMISMLLLPWQQTSRGTGQVVAYVPQERQQTVESPIKGVVSRIADGIVENSRVKKGQTILEVQPFAENLEENLLSQKKNLNDKLGTYQTQFEVHSKNIKTFTDAQTREVNSAKELVKAAQDKLAGKEALVKGYKAKEKQTKLQLDRQQKLFLDGLKPEKEIEKFQSEWEFAAAELADVEKEVLALKREVKSKQELVEAKRLNVQTKIDTEKIYQQKAQGEIFSIEKELGLIDLKLEPLKRNEIKANRDGTIFRMHVNELGKSVKEGDPLFTIVPDTDQKAVELFVVGNDMPLVEVGQEVRLQFEGWPAVQFAGWPSVAVGTFGGRVATVDATDDGRGQFRIVILPFEDGDEWPSDRYLRQGVRVNGWVMLRQVTLGFEVWRQLNGFPKIVASEEPGKTIDKKISKPKLPK